MPARSRTMRCSAGRRALAGGEPGDLAAQFLDRGLQIAGDASFVEVFFDQEGHILRGDRAVNGCFRIDDHQRGDILPADIAPSWSEKLHPAGRTA